MKLHWFARRGIGQALKVFLSKWYIFFKVLKGFGIEGGMKLHRFARRGIGRALKVADFQSRAGHARRYWT